MHLKSAVALAALAMASVPAAAQLQLHTQTNDPVTGLSPSEWEQMVSHMLNVQGLVGDPGVIVVSSLSEPITVTCDRWQLVGTNPYSSVRGNPAQIQPFSITYIKTKEFDGYCKGGVIGHGTMGKTITGHLDSTDGSFSNSTVILFSAHR